MVGKPGGQGQRRRDWVVPVKTSEGCAAALFGYMEWHVADSEFEMVPVVSSGEKSEGQGPWQDQKVLLFCFVTSCVVHPGFFNFNFVYILVIP